MTKGLRLRPYQQRMLEKLKLNSELPHLPPGTKMEFHDPAKITAFAEASRRTVRDFQDDLLRAVADTIGVPKSAMGSEYGNSFVTYAMMAAEIDAIYGNYGKLGRFEDWMRRQMSLYWAQFRRPRTDDMRQMLEDMGMGR